jgi:hypothetical protein
MPLITSRLHSFRVACARPEDKLQIIRRQQKGGQGLFKCHLYSTRKVFRTGQIDCDVEENPYWIQNQQSAVIVFANSETERMVTEWSRWIYKETGGHSWQIEIPRNHSVLSTAPSICIVKRFTVTEPSGSLVQFCSCKQTRVNIDNFFMGTVRLNSLHAEAHNNWLNISPHTDHELGVLVSCLYTVHHTAS